MQNFRQSTVTEIEEKNNDKGLNMQIDRLPFPEKW